MLADFPQSEEVLKGHRELPMNQLRFPRGRGSAGTRRVCRRCRVEDTVGNCCCLLCVPWFSAFRILNVTGRTVKLMRLSSTFYAKIGKKKIRTEWRENIVLCKWLDLMNKFSF